jgi:hypothetical protein
VRLVDQHDDAAAFAIAADEVLLQLAHRDGRALARKREPEIVADRVKNFFPRERRRREVDRVDVRRQPLHEDAAQHGLAAADLARDLHDALVVQHRVDQAFERRAAVGAVEEEVGVRGNAERRLLQPEVFEVQSHYFCSP